MRRRVCQQGNCDRIYARPDARLRPGIGSYRGFRLTGGVPQQRLVVPRGTVSLLIGFGGELRVGHAGRHGDTAPADSRHRSVVSGLHSRARVIGHAGDLQGVEITLAPWAAHRLLGDTALGELADTVTDPAEVLGPRFRRLGEALEAAPEWQERFAILDRALLGWTAAAGASRTPSAPVLNAWDTLTRTAGTIRISELAARTGWGLKHLETRFREQIGLTPKRLARVLRLNRAIRMLGAGSRPSDAALACGLYDQSHLTREFKAMTGMPPGRFLAARANTSLWMAG
ncbi:helix-turn-helix domain-containing protein [Streptomyces sp. NBC_01236]|uniref:helix-turn-helix domain-containing protein n=1 Tax=Streptomyces sp. NBC_01236 TaxID=2903789 RepID=UPI002E165234|nr:helix-turn-helix domain-containing protein [Streptomyces sp. NBC_01236]